MWRGSRLALFGAGLLGSLILAGCDQPEKAHVSRAPVRPALLAQQVAAAPQTQLPPLPPQPPAAPPPTVAVVEKRPPEAVSPASPPPQALVPVAGGEEESAAQPVQPAQPADPRPSPPSHRGEEAPARKSFTDITARSSFGHAADYSWVSGEVEYSRISKAWRLRYASVDEEDTYGGSVTLADHPLLHDLKDGQQVRVRGQVTNPGPRGIAPPYLIESLEPIPGPDAARTSGNPE